jgi:hypothetical protein
VWAHGDTVLLATTKYPPLLVSFDAGDTWGQAMDVPEGMAFLGNRIDQVASVYFYVASSDRDIPLLFMAESPSGPWQPVLLQMGRLPSLLLGGLITGVGLSGPNGTTLLVAHQGRVYAADLYDESKPFVEWLCPDTPGVSVLTRADRWSNDVFVTGDSLYVSHDAGLTWTSYASPHGGSLIASVLDWDSGVLYTVEWLDGWGEVYRLNVRSLISD